jgi:Cu+-exporting ATPase
MSCAACAGRVERSLLATPGVSAVQVNLADESASFEGPAPLPALAAGLRRAGYALREEVLEWRVGGMSCASCTGRVERALLAVPGVIEAAANLATERVTMRILAGTDAGLLEAALSRAGYRLAAEEAPLAGWDREDLILGAAALLVAPFLLGMLGMAVGQDWMPSAWVQLVLAAVLLFGPGLRFHRGALAALRARTGNMDLLVSLGTGAAFGLSAWLMARGHAHGHDDGLYFEAAAAVTFFVLLGKRLEARARRATGAAFQALLDLRPRTARRLADGAEEEIPAALLRAGDTIAIRPGERVPADALVLEGEAAADEAPLTGESRPVEKRPGSQLSTGTTLLDGRLLARVTATGNETVLARVAGLVAAAQASRAPIQQLVDRVSAVFVPVVVVLAGLTAIGWLLAGAAAEAAIINAVTVLVVACPCALGLATPAAIMAGTGAAARAGILLRDAQAIERGAAITLVAFDKTGTLTEGRPRLAALHGVPEALRLAASLQAGSEHPLARAVTAAHGAAPPPVGAFRALPGRGVRGVVEGRTLLLGSARLLEEAGLADPFVAEAEAAAAAGQSVAWLIEEGAGALALLAFEDTPRPSTRGAIAALLARGLQVRLLSGDNEAAARALAGPLGIAGVEADLLPADKLDRIRAWQAAGQRVAMVGDGINDAPALVQADLGIAMGSGTDAAMAAAPVTLLRPDLALVPAALEVARRTSSRIRQNLFFAFAYNAALLPLAALGMLSPALAGGAMALSSVSVLANALWLARWSPAEEAKR